ncbi:MAG: hypothetical protein IIB17_11175 [Chloroflexi bacterium]|nr:hypothetical protein [Chloroflexota bacterium]
MKATQRYSCVIILEFEDTGNLPPGIYETTWEEFAHKFGHNPHRKKLLEGLREAMLNLKLAGCQVIFIDGSFVTSKERPGDFDGCWDTDGVDGSLVYPVLLDLRDGRQAQKTKYYGELFPARVPEGVSGQTFLEFLQHDPVIGEPKGIVEIQLRNF